MILIHFLVMLAFIIIGAKIGGIGVAFAGGAGVLTLALLGATPGDLPMQVIVFIMVVIYAASAMQAAGGLDYLVNLTDRLLRAHPTYLAILAPLVTYTLTFMASTGQVSFATMPVIVEVAKDNNIRPTRSLSVAVAGSLLGITASPISAAVVFLSTQLEDRQTGWTFIDLILVSIPATFLGTMVTAVIFMLWDKARGNDTLEDVPEYQRRLAEGKVAAPKREVRRLRPGAGSPGCAARRSTAALRPSSVLVGGIRTSVTTTSGSSPAVASLATSVRSASASATWATTSWPAAASSPARPSHSRAASSASRILMRPSCSSAVGPREPGPRGSGPAPYSARANANKRFFRIFQYIG